MENLFIILLLFSLTSLGVGLINPKVFSRFLKEKATRKNLALLFSGLTILFFILFAMTAPPTGKESSYTLDSETQLNNLETDEESLNDAESLQENNLEESLQETSQPSNSTPPPTDTGSSSTTQETQSPQNSPPQQEQKQPPTGEVYYTSSHHTAKYYYPESCSGWKGLSPTYLKKFNSLQELLKAYPSRTLNPNC